MVKPELPVPMSMAQRCWRQWKHRSRLGCHRLSGRCNSVPRSSLTLSTESPYPDELSTSRRSSGTIPRDRRYRVTGTPVGERNSKFRRGFPEFENPMSVTQALFLLRNRAMSLHITQESNEAVAAIQMGPSHERRRFEELDIMLVYIRLTLKLGT